MGLRSKARCGCSGFLKRLARRRGRPLRSCAGPPLLHRPPLRSSPQRRPGVTPRSAVGPVTRSGRDGGGQRHVLIAGGGVAALEAALALRALAEDRVRVELIAPEPRFWYRPLAAGRAVRARRSTELRPPRARRRDGCDVLSGRASLRGRGSPTRLHVAGWCDAVRDARRRVRYDSVTGSARGAHVPWARGHGRHGGAGRRARGRPIRRLASSSRSEPRGACRSTNWR
jgi:hypothetical protein